MKYELMHPELLEITCPNGELAVGGSQDWYPGRWQKLSGCGPTAASNLIWYMSRTRPGLKTLCDVGAGDYGHFLELMLEFFSHLTPGLKGVNKSWMFIDGITRFCAARNMTLGSRALEIPKELHERPGIDSAGSFITAALQADAPLGFLNLNSGTLADFEDWHWVTIIGYDAEETAATITDKGRVQHVDLSEWLKTSKLGGAMVYLESDIA